MALTLAVLSPFLLAPLIPVLNRYVKFHVGWFVALIPFLNFVFFASHLPQLMNGEVVQVLYQWIPSIGINFTLYLDGLSLLFTMLITGIGTLVVLYSIFYLDSEEPLGNFYVYILLFMGAMLGVVTSNNLILLYIFWELTSFSSFLLIGFWYYRNESRYGAQKSMMITVLGGFAMLAGFVLLYVITGTFDIRELVAQAEVIKAHAFYLPALILILIGAFTKSAQVPFHIWLPNAMEAPTPVSAYLHSATMVKAGIFLIARLTPILAGTAAWFLIVSTVGILTLVMGAFLAIRQTDLKAILAFSTVSQLGLIVTLLGYGTPAAILGATFHLLNHAAFKGSLFMMVGIVDHETGTRDIRRLSGLAKKMPYTAAIAGIGTLAMAGVPPFNGFLSKEMFFVASLEALSTTYVQASPWTILFPSIALLGSIFTFVYSMMIFHGVFFGPLTQDTDKKPHEAPLGLLLPGLFLASLNIIIGLYPKIVGNTILGPVTEAILTEPMKIKITLWHGFNLPLVMSMAVVVFGGLLYWQLGKTKQILALVPARPSSNAVYDWTIVNMVKGAKKITDWQMTGYLRDYILFIMSFTVLVAGGTIYLRQGFSFNMVNLAPIAIYEAIIAVLIVAAAITVVLSKSRLAAIIALGMVGYSVALLFILFRAPDLALTQLIVETVTLALFLLVFYHLPKEIVPETGKSTIKGLNVVVSVLTGVVMTVMAISAHNLKSFESISAYFVENSYKLAGGRNIVNVILVDFRGFDTMGEITVLGIAGFAVYAMIMLRLKRGKQS
ncbi:MAG: Na+/H+ antiporter subunit A [Bacillota bacterium]|nr:Na+/H+ antiporter subunit A [Bacillota bacterium]